MKKNNNMSLAAIMMVGAVSALGYKYMMDHPRTKRNMKNMMKDCTKKLYQKLDEMD